MATLHPYLLAIGAIVLMMGAWIVVQFAWRKVFRQVARDEDVLAIRPGCQECARDRQCDQKPSGASETRTEACRIPSDSGVPEHRL